MRQAPDEHLYFAGIDGNRGGYFHPPLALREALARLGEGLDPPAFSGPRPALDHRELSAAGWGVIFAPGTDPAVREALSPLLDLRREQAAAMHGVLFRELTWAPGESAWDFLARHGAAPGPADPRRLPFYLLLVGGPAAIPFAVQEQLGLHYAVGRVAFDSPEEYARYAFSVVAAESAPADRGPEVALFAPSHPDDPATARLAAGFTDPLAAALQSGDGWTTRTCAGREATKAALLETLGGEGKPALLLFSGHGLAFPPGDPRQRRAQGALLCADWPGPERWGERAIPPQHCLAAGDLPAGGELHGLVAFLLASYGAGTPERENLFGTPEAGALTPEPFVAALARRLLAHPQGGALAVVGRVGRAWAYPSSRLRGQRQAALFAAALRSLEQGEPIGAALLFLRQARVEASAYLRALTADDAARDASEPGDLVALWTACQELRLTLLGDPAVHLATAGREAWLYDPRIYPWSRVAVAAEVGEGPPEGGGDAGTAAVTPFAARVSALVFEQLSELEARFAAQGRPLDEVASARELAERMLATVPSPSRWDEVLGPFYTTAQVAGLLGGISRQAVMDRCRRRTLLGLKTADGVWVYPLFQFDEANRVLPGLAPVLQCFDPADVDEWTLASWLVSPLASLGERSAIDWLREGRDLEPALAQARGAARRFSE
jgi:hypothetical protein